MLKKLAIAILLTTTLGVAGCEWEYPLSSPQQGKRDEALVGFWRLKTANDNCILAFTQAEKLPEDGRNFKEFDASHLQHVLISNFIDLNYPSQPGGEPDLCWAWTTVIDGVNYLNLQYREEPTVGKDQSVSIVKYQVEGEKLHWWKLSEKAIDRMDKKLGQEYTAAELRAEILSTGEADWGKATLTRIR